MAGVNSRRWIAVVLWVCCAFGFRPAWGQDSIEVEVHGWGIADSVRIRMARDRVARVSGDISGTQQGDFRARLASLQEYNRSLLQSLKADVDALMSALAQGGYSRAESRVRMDAIRRRRLEARLGLNLMGFLNRMGSDYAAQWGNPVRVQRPAAPAKNVLVVNRTRRKMAVDVWDTDTVQVEYVPVFAGFRGEPMPPAEALERMAEVNVEVEVYDSTAVQRISEDLGLSGSLLAVTVSDPRGRQADPGVRDEAMARGVLVFPSVMAPRSARLLLDGAEPVAERDLEGVEVVRVPDGERLKAQLDLDEPASSIVPPEEKTSAKSAPEKVKAVAPVAPVVPKEEPDALPEEGIEALFRKGEALLAAGDPAAAAEAFRTMLEADHRHAPAYVGLGQAYFRQGDLKAAEGAFRDALRWDRHHAPAYNGLGLVFMESENLTDWAIRYFRDACREDPAYVEGHYNLAEALRRFGSTETLKAYEEVVALDPAHAEAWFRMGQLHESEEDYGAAETAYRKQVAVHPDHLEARAHLGGILRRTGRPEEAVEVLEAVASVPGEHRRGALLDLVAVYQKLRRHEGAAALLEAFVEDLPAEEQAVFRDLSLVASRETLEAFEAAPDSEKAALSRAFWAGQDPAPVTVVNERKVEHDRRVAYARAHFGKVEFPWDARGEAYVRFGEPDHISRSRRLKFETDARVVEVKQRLEEYANRAMVYEDSGPGARLRPGGPDRAFDRRTSLLEITPLPGRPVFPVSSVRAWEYWLYAEIGAGIQMVFEEREKDVYDFVRMPVWTGLDPTHMLRTWQQMHPRAVIDAMKSTTPAVYRGDFASGPLDFFFDSAGFRGEEGQTELEVYYGIPNRDLAFVEEAGRPTVFLQRGMALYDSTGRQVLRKVGAMSYYSEGPVDTTKQAFVPVADRVLVRPGTYRLQVQVLDETSGRSQVYSQEVSAPSFAGDSLRLSDVELAAAIRPAASEGKFVKGGIEVVPNPTRAFLPGQEVFLYYEVYNLAADEFGATRYRVSYEVRSREKKSVAARILGGLGTLLGMREEKGAVTIEYEHVGEASEDQGYLELDMSNTALGDHVLTVRVADLVSGQEAVSERMFRIGE